MIEMLGGDTQAAHHLTLIGVMKIVMPDGMSKQRQLCRQQQRHQRRCVATRNGERWSKAQHGSDANAKPAATQSRALR